MLYKTFQLAETLNNTLKHFALQISDKNTR